MSPRKNLREGLLGEIRRLRKDRRQLQAECDALRYIAALSAEERRTLEVVAAYENLEKFIAQVYNIDTLQEFLERPHPKRDDQAGSSPLEDAVAGFVVYERRTGVDLVEIYRTIQRQQGQI